MAQVTDPIILDSTGQAIKNSIDLLSANINRTASNIPYDDNLTIKGKIDAINLTSGGTIIGTLNINGNEQIYRGNNRVNIYPSTSLSANRDFILPNASGTAALMETGSMLEKVAGGENSTSYNFDMDGNSLYLLTTGQIGGGGSFVCNPCVYFVWVNNNSSHEVATQILVQKSTNIALSSIAYVSGNTYTFTFAGANRVRLFKMIAA